MSFQASEILHKGLQRFWKSGGKDLSGISPAWASAVRAILVHLNSADSLDDIRGGLGLLKNVKHLSGHACRYSIEVNANWRVTFDCPDATNGAVYNIDLEDLHRPGGAKRR
jgi:plasmid maintenance system killer protein